MKRFLKGALLIVLFVAVIVLAAIPARSAQLIEIPGEKGAGSLGSACICVEPIYPDCTCVIVDPNG